MRCSMFDMQNRLKMCMIKSPVSYLVYFFLFRGRNREREVYFRCQQIICTCYLLFPQFYHLFKSLSIVFMCLCIPLHTVNTNTIQYKCSVIKSTSIVHTVLSSCWHCPRGVNLKTLWFFPLMSQTVGHVLHWMASCCNAIQYSTSFNYNLSDKVKLV